MTILAFRPVRRMLAAALVAAFGAGTGAAADSGAGTRAAADSAAGSGAAADSGAAPDAARARPAAAPVPASLAPVLVTGNPLGSERIASPSSVLSGDGLVLRRASTLGETLDGLPGVSSTWFGPNANRPVIRGQDGDRIRVLANGGASLDAASLSFDHAVPIDPLVIERVEVLRGPAALLYGGSAVGGVVNAIDNRIPRTPVRGASGAAELRAGGAASEKGASALVEAGLGGGLSLHADAFARRTSDLRVPAFDRPVDGGGTERRERVVNSASDAKGGALGASYAWAGGFVGASVDTYRNDYGVVVEDEVSIAMKRDRFALAGELRDLRGPLAAVRAQLSHTDYEHRELEGAEVGTTFRNRGEDARVELVHAKLPLGGGVLEGVVGLQAERSRFSALGEEAFVPGTRSRSAALFVMEQWRSSPSFALSAGVRAERVRIASDGDAADATEPRFGPARSRSFSPASASLGAVWDVAPAWQFTAHVAHTERAPTQYELYADGVHVATATFERGDSAQRLERGANVDLALQWRDGPARVKAGVFASRFSNYIALAATGEPDFVNDEGEAFPVYAFRGVRARLEGLELETGWTLLQGVRTLDLEARLDFVRGRDLTRGEPLPRLAPLRATVGLALAQGPWGARVELRHAARQSRVPADDVATPAWTIVDASLTRRATLGTAEALWFVKVANLGDRLAYNASSIRTVRELAPLPGRSVSAGLRVTFD